MRAGAFGLSLLSDPLDAGTLLALDQGSLPLIELRRAVGSPPQTTLRKHLKILTDLGVLVRSQDSGFPGPVSYELSPSGRELLSTAKALSAWLSAAPGGPLQVGTPAAKSAIRAMVDGWSTKIVRALAAKPLSLTELDRLLSDVNYPALERRLGAMRLAGQIVPVPGRNGSTPYKVARWLRGAVRPLAAATTWEQRHASDRCEPLRRLDIEAIFLLAVPLLALPSCLKGSCRLAVDFSNGNRQTHAGLVVAVEGGRPVSCVSELGARVTSSAAGSATAWLEVLSGGREINLAIDGDDELGGAVVSGLPQGLLRQADPVEMR